jgi:hypothetical protein
MTTRGGCTDGVGGALDSERSSPDLSYRAASREYERVAETNTERVKPADTLTS